jgi:hypothetical protein
MRVVLDWGVQNQKVIMFAFNVSQSCKDDTTKPRVERSATLGTDRTRLESCKDETTAMPRIELVAFVSPFQG